MLKELKVDCRRSGRKKDVMMYMFFYRLGNKVYYSNVNNFLKKILLLIIKIPKKILDILFNCEIPFSTNIGSGIKIPHLNGIIIHPNAVIGERCTIYHQVTVGANEHIKDWRLCPHIGDRVYIGAGSKIIGNISVGSDVTIGANTVITKNTPDNCIIVGSNKIIKNNSKDYTFIY